MTANQPNPPVDRLVREQAIILLDLTTLSDVQHAAVAGGDTDALTRVLDQRQALIDRLARVAESLADRSAELQAAAEARDERGARVARDLAEVSRLWSALASRDSEDLANLHRQKDELARELASLGKGGRAAGAYARPAGGAIFQDTEA